MSLGSPELPAEDKQVEGKWVKKDFNYEENILGITAEAWVKGQLLSCRDCTTITRLGYLHDHAKF